MTSVFTNKNDKPSETDVKSALGDTFVVWNAIKDFTLQSAPMATQEWKYTSSKFGWAFRINDARRVLVYLLPRDGFFRVGLVYGHKATEAIMAAEISPAIKQALSEAPTYAEGKGIRLEVRDNELLTDIEKLIRIKLHY